MGIQMSLVNLFPKFNKILSNLHMAKRCLLGLGQRKLFYYTAKLDNFMQPPQVLPKFVICNIGSNTTKFLTVTAD